MSGSISFPASPSAFTSAWTRSADVFMSMPDCGMDDWPIPGRSGAITVWLDESTFASGAHMRADSA